MSEKTAAKESAPKMKLAQSQDYSTDPKNKLPKIEEEKNSSFNQNNDYNVEVDSSEPN